MPIENLPKGALPDSPDDHDYKVTSEMIGEVTVDWTKIFRLPDPGNEDQGSSDSCVAQAWSVAETLRSWVNTISVVPTNESRPDLES